MRLELKPTDRIHMLVWKHTQGEGWCAALAVDGLPIDYAFRFGTWQEAMDCALERASAPR